MAGLKFWALNDSWGEKLNWGLVSLKDNAYDGKEAIVAAGVDPWGYSTGGEDSNYGDFLSFVTAANNSVYDTIYCQTLGATSVLPVQKKITIFLFFPILSIVL